MEWKRSGVLKLIELFKREPVLWKLSHPNHKNFNCRIEAMKRIAEEMETTPSDVEKKLHTLRSQYLREKVRIVRSKRVATCASEIYTPKWQYYKILSFLPSTSKPENTNSINLVEKLVKDVIDGTNSIPEAEIEGDANNSSIPSQAQLFGELENGSPSPSPQVSASKSRKRNPDSELSGIEKKINLLMTSSVGKTRDENISFDDFVAEEVTPTIRKRNPDFELLSGHKKKMSHSYDVMTSNSGKARDEDTCFGDFVTEALKKLPDRRMKAWVRSKITNILFEAEFGGESSQPHFQPHPMSSTNFVNSSQQMQHSSQHQSPYNSPNSSYASSHSPKTNDLFKNNSPLQIQITPD
ncbi:uncharacterized protein LOC111051829 [Nilaparvata lugens]|uniref:uncharacterized protein LOC111051829 n=1 Tax=Nilaparvata lugens TaxID=108931 RepID=UPI00193CFA6E|nr:uncharacterized protein LOC111051829 [Nilaparvata lugens]